MSDLDNPIYSSINQIFILNDNGSISLEVNRKNEECEFHRLEMNASVFDIFPSGTLIVKDNNDIISKIATRGINKVKIIFQNGESRFFRIHAVNNINNYASSTENPYVGIYFSNDFYTYCQENTLSDIAMLQKPKVFKIDELVKAIAGSDFTTIDTTSNYACFRPLNPKMDGTEISTDNVAEYLNYLASLALSDQEMLGQPRFLFWTDWRDDALVNFHFLKKIESYPISARYKIYSDDSAARGNLRKIYSYTTNQALQYITREYYYVRKTPKVLDIPKPEDNVYKRLAYQFLDEGEKYNIEVVGSDGRLNTIPRGAEEIYPETLWGYVSGNNTSGLHSVSTHANQQYGYSSTYKAFKLGEFTGAYEFVDNPEMWKNMFDLTPLHPNYPENNDSRPFNLQTVLDIKYRAQNNESGSAETQFKKIREIELQNFVLYALCCMGTEEKEESFYAKLTKHLYDANYSDGTKRKWLYEWKQIIFDPKREQTEGETTNDAQYSSKWLLLNNAEYWKEGADNSTISGFAINLNESGNLYPGEDPGAYIQPGWRSLTKSPDSPLRNMRYRPIGSMSGTGVDPETTVGGESNAIVKMYKKSWEKILIEGGYTGGIPESAKGKYLCYFIAENVVDGECAGTA